MPCFAVVDTNVLVSALNTKNPESPTCQVFKAMLSGDIIPLYHEDILSGYKEVLSRKKFHLDLKNIETVVSAIRQYGIEAKTKPIGEILPDMDNLIFYEVAMEKREDNAYLVTCNQKHFPIKTFIVTPAEMVEILEKK